MICCMFYVYILVQVKNICRYRAIKFLLLSTILRCNHANSFPCCYDHADVKQFIPPFLCVSFLCVSGDWYFVWHITYLHPISASCFSQYLSIKVICQTLPVSIQTHGFLDFATLLPNIQYWKRMSRQLLEYHVKVFWK